MEKWTNKGEFKLFAYICAEDMKVPVKRISVRDMKNKWASCSTKGNLTFNKELLDLDRDFGEYVIVHELLHFHVPNHGKLWKSLMRAHLGEYEEVERRLKEFSNKNNMVL
jgi:predicted metal-dependent hydrolase